MINVSFTKDKNCDLHLSIKGHAGYSNDGKDIVCAAVSAIFYCLLGYLNNTHKEDLEIIELRAGNATIKCSQKSIEPMRMACIGLLQIGESYPGYIKIKNNIWKSNIA